MSSLWTQDRPAAPARHVLRLVRTVAPRGVEPIRQAGTAYVKTTQELATAAPEAAVVAAAAAVAALEVAVAAEAVVNTVARAQVARQLVRLAVAFIAVPVAAKTATVP